jgi:thiol-disulfide isomerase/thioredoxin
MVMTNVAVVLIGVLGLVNFALTFAVIRQVRRYGEQLASRGAGRRQPAWHIQAGSPVPEFTAATVSGGRVSLSDLTGARSVIAFFSVGCPPCRVQLPEFTRYARSFPGGAAQVLAVVFGGEGEREETDGYVRELAGAATVVVEPPGGPTAQAFSVSGYPTLYVLDERGRVETSGMAVRRIAAAVPA